MTVKSLYAEICTLALTVALILISVASFAAATEQVIFNFPKAGSGGVTLVYHSGRFYGTSPSGAIWFVPLGAADRYLNWHQMRAEPGIIKRCTHLMATMALDLKAESHSIRWGTFMAQPRMEECTGPAWRLS
jgi:hypothetical protein